MEPAAAPPSLQRYFSCVTKLIVDKKGEKKELGIYKRLPSLPFVAVSHHFMGR
jgi:hypothetical protein